MSQSEKKGIYVYQPYGIQDGKERWNLGLIYGVGGLPLHTTIKGLTKDGAERVAAALRHEHNYECIDASGRCMITGEV
jgi:DUF1009 family protein